MQITQPLQNAKPRHNVQTFVVDYKKFGVILRQWRYSVERL